MKIKTLVLLEIHGGVLVGVRVVTEAPGEFQVVLIDHDVHEVMQDYGAILEQPGDPDETLKEIHEDLSKRGYMLR